jgi:hypothetical protein
MLVSYCLVAITGSGFEIIYNHDENLCKGLVVNLLPLTSEVFKRLANSGKSGDTNCG